MKKIISILVLVLFGWALYENFVYFVPFPDLLFGGEANIWQRMFMHALGSIVVATLLLLLSKIVSRKVIGIAAMAIILYFLFQELYVHPLVYSQPLYKGVLDIFSWTVLLVLFLWWQQKGVLSSEQKGGDGE